MKTHPNLKSLVTDVDTASRMNRMVGHALAYQEMFDHRTSPWEMSKWEEDELFNFKVNLQKVDRLYHIQFHDDEIEQRDFELVARMEYKPNTWVFVELLASCDYSGFDCKGGGEIYVCFDPQIFLKSVLNRDYCIRKIWQSLVQDGYEVEEPTEHELLPLKLWSSVPMLKFLCHLAVYKHQKVLNLSVLPKHLLNSVTEFIRIRGTKDHHDDGWS